MEPYTELIRPNPSDGRQRSDRERTPSTPARIDCIPPKPSGTVYGNGSPWADAEDSEHRPRE